ncbi:hypothetical protein AUEXF2481DRAFT_42085 [Aureobasidium subglaciale EXF-2481]|uniref:Uncharacterized protein n=1 Tax=Aureobasidium subglaciale (strain EXF-2481) TaxID=1043005 RepID=A0A074Z2R7_AURSE|nr:uncharacterized protein AUEXF2481DRAFT_42085 [Aureobasidium subglaciale EXF-2481]KEQ93356.1 hypothetical protein AUEXF2481DRAFT_42085 [Aureobasidium subglaciale EXF-2481]
MTRPYLFGQNHPHFRMVNCTPFVEHTNASVKADLQTGFVHSYEILGPPQNTTQAWNLEVIDLNTNEADNGEQEHLIRDSRYNERS